MVSGAANESKNGTIAQRKRNKEETRDVYLIPPFILNVNDNLSFFDVYCCWKD